MSYGTKTSTPRMIDGVADAGEVDIARRFLAPGVAAVAVAAFGFAVANAIFGVRYRDLDRRGIAPLVMASLTAAVAAWSYFNPQPINLVDRRQRRKQRRR